jgi:3-methylfumaryl-CoA hydratase
MNTIPQNAPSAPSNLDWCERNEICSASVARRVAAMLDLDPDDIVEGGALPRGWQFTLMAADTRRSLLRADGFPGLGVTMPDLGLPRLLLGGRKVAYNKDLPIGAVIRRRSAIRSLTQKKSESGPMAIATIQHELRVGTDELPALVEEQTYLLLPARKGGSHSDVSGAHMLNTGLKTSTVVPDETMLFQYSALGFNSHRIHIDRAHARNVEGFPDLVVNGGLATLLMTEFLRREVGVTPSALKIKHVAPLYCGRPITLVADQPEGRWRVQAFDHRATLAVDMEIETHEL